MQTETSPKNATATAEDRKPYSAGWFYAQADEIPSGLNFYGKPALVNDQGEFGYAVYSDAGYSVQLVTKSTSPKAGERTQNMGGGFIRGANYIVTKAFGRFGKDQIVSPISVSATGIVGVKSGDETGELPQEYLCFESYEGGTQLVSGEYLAPNVRVHIYKPDTHPIDKMVRLYCTQWGYSWKLQVRGPLSVGCNGTKSGKSSVIASADLSLEQMISLKDALSEFISEAQEAIFKAQAVKQHMNRLSTEDRTLG